LVRRRWRDGAVAFSVASTGLIEMGVEFVVLLGFQVVYGYVYQYIGVLVAAFMLGLALGAWVSSRWARAGRATWRRMQAVQLCICAYPLLLLGFLVLATRARLAAAPALAGVAFSLVAFAAGFVGGLQFPLAAALHSARNASAGTLYGLDLFGACLGALAVSSVLVPTFGLSGVCGMLCALGALGLVGLAAAGRGAAAKSC
jgi:spermidine synthase